MSRPRTLKLEHGEVSLQGFSKEQADALSEHIKAFNKVTEVKEELPASYGQTMQVSNMYNEKAIGFQLNSTTGKYEVFTVLVDVANSAAVVDKVEVLEFRRDAISKFKMLAFEYKFV